MNPTKILILFCVLCQQTVNGQTAFQNYDHQTQKTIDSLQESGVWEFLIYFRWDCVGCPQLVDGKTGKQSHGKHTYIIWKDSLAKDFRLLKYDIKEAVSGIISCDYVSGLFENFEKMKNESDGKEPVIKLSDGYSFSELTIIREKDSLTFAFKDSYQKTDTSSVRKVYLSKIKECLVKFEKKQTNH